jgi:hypothetical protein
MRWEAKLEIRRQIRVVVIPLRMNPASRTCAIKELKSSGLSK